ncbi:hypothetical protein pb186bvf_009638 [Paramecium bursaria]
MSFQLLKSNTNSQLRHIQGETVVLISVVGPFPVQTQKACQSAIIDVQIKWEREYELEIKTILEELIILKEYPSQMIRIICVIQQNKGNLFSALINGLQMNKTLMAYEENIGILVLNALDNQIIFLKNQELQLQEIKDFINRGRELTLNYQQLLRSYLYEYISKTSN